MKYLLILLTLSIFSLNAFGSSDTTDTNTQIKLNPFINSLELKNIIDNKNLIILDVDNKDIYNSGHIAGAIHFNVDSLVKSILNQYNLMEEDLNIQNEIQKLGVRKNSAVVIYAHNTLAGNQNSAYLALVLITYGFENVSILDGGYMTWVFENKRLVSTTSNDVKYNNNFKIEKNKNIIVNKDYILTNLNNIIMLDTRETKYYFGTHKTNEMPEFGHISGAKSSYTADKFLIDGLLRDKKELQSIYYQGLNLRVNDNIVVYAENIFQASMEWYLLYKVMNFKNVKIYEAGLKEYFEDNANAVTRFKFE
jgi:thiosulfate/3-mercaptopyruvate sulfurtransferase